MLMIIGQNLTFLSVVERKIQDIDLHMVDKLSLNFMQNPCPTVTKYTLFSSKQGTDKNLLSNEP